MNKGYYVVILEPKQEPYFLLAKNPYDVIDVKIGGVTDCIYVGENKDILVYIDDAACCDPHLALNRRVQGLGIVRGTMVICNIYSIDEVKKEICGFDDDGVKIALEWANTCTNVIWSKKDTFLQKINGFKIISAILQYLDIFKMTWKKKRHTQSALVIDYLKHKDYKNNPDNKR